MNRGGVGRGEGLMGVGWNNFLSPFFFFQKKCPFFHKNVPFLANIERCSKFLEYALVTDIPSCHVRYIFLERKIRTKLFSPLCKFTKNIMTALIHITYLANSHGKSCTQIYSYTWDRGTKEKRIPPIKFVNHQWKSVWLLNTFKAGICLLKVDNRNTRTGVKFLQS